MTHRLTTVAPHTTQPHYFTPLDSELLLTKRPRHGLTGLEIELLRAVHAVIEVNLDISVDEERISAPLDELVHES
jgi:hypothetical protein